MLTVDYIDVLNGACDLCGLPRAGSSPPLQAVDQAKLQLLISKRLESAVRFHYWPDWVRVENRFFRLNYASGTTYAAPTATAASEVYFPATRTYYQALRSSLGNAPATLSGGIYATNDAYWAVAAGSYSGNDWAASTAYALAAIVRNPDDGLFYQCHTAHTSGGSFDATKFGILTAFNRYVGYTVTGQTAIGDALGCWNLNPFLTYRAVELKFGLSHLGVQVLAPATSVWLRYRLRIPPLSGAVYSATATYSVGQQVYYSSATLAGNFYDCAVTTTAGQSPDTTAASWAIVELPRMFEDYLKFAAYADWLNSDGQNDKALQAEKQARNWLAREASILTGQSQQNQSIGVAVR